MSNVKIQNLFGLVLVGGKSTRMGKDKAALRYYGKSQSIHCYEMLTSFCENVFLSNRKGQAEEEGQKGYPQIHDKEPFLEVGPMGGILSAMAEYPEADWLVLACDLPFVSSGVLEYLLKHRNHGKKATAFVSRHDHLPEPLCAVYERHCRDFLLAYFQQGKHCPRQFLIQSDAELLVAPYTLALENVNNPEELQSSLKKLKEG